MNLNNIKMKIEWMETHMREAEKMITDNQVNEGMAVLNQLLFEEPGYASLHNHIGWAHLYYTAENERAEQHLKLAIKFGIPFPAPYQHLGVLFTRLGRYDEALEILNEGLKQPAASRPIFWEGIAQAHELKREYGNAIHAYKEAMASSLGTESTHYAEGIKRCRKKRWVMMFTF